MTRHVGDSLVFGRMGICKCRSEPLRASIIIISGEASERKNSIALVNCCRGRPDIQGRGRCTSLIKAIWLLTCGVVGDHPASTVKRCRQQSTWLKHSRSELTAVSGYTSSLAADCYWMDVDIADNRLYYKCLCWIHVKWLVICNY